MSEAAAPAARAGYVALSGWTNVGKSTLLNRLVGTKIAAVADVPQTTRRRALGVRNLPGRGQIVFVDTPGLHRARHRMNRRMLEAARLALEGVDLCALVVDAARGIGAGDREAARLVGASGVPALLVLNKVDLVQPKEQLLPLIARAAEEWGIDRTWPVSARTGEGCDALLEGMLEALPPGDPPFEEDFLTDQTERTLVAEWIREQLLHATRQELPHATAVVVDRWHERPDGLLEVGATIFVERESQKAIVIGRGGELLKRVGTAARRELEPLLGRRMHLETWVKVRPRWRDDERCLRELELD